MVTSSLNIASDNQDDEGEGDESEDELEDDVPWRSPSEKIAYVQSYYKLPQQHPYARSFEFAQILFHFTIQVHRYSKTPVFQCLPFHQIFILLA